MLIMCPEEKKSYSNKPEEEDGPTLYYYIETDGKVYLIEKSGMLQFPTEKDPLPFEIIEKKVMSFDSYYVKYCGPVLDKHPHDWLNKDDLPKLDNLHQTVRESLHMSFPRCVAEVILIKEGKVLLVNASRGVTSGMWNLPGGFMEYGESPEECILREVKEELGLEASIKDLIGIYTKASAFHPFHLIAFVYLCIADDYEFKLDPDEIAEAEWFGIDEALEITKNHFTILALEEYKAQRKI